MIDRARSGKSNDDTRRPISNYGRASLRRLVLLGILGWIGWQVIVNAAADSRAELDPQAALALRPNLPAALVNEASQRLIDAKTADDIEQASATSEKALIASPLAPGALRIIGLADDLLDRPDQARAVMDLAGKASLRDTVAQVWLFDEDIRDGDVERAIAQADTLLRTRVDLADHLLPALAAVAATPAGSTALVKVLSADPPWRGMLLAALPKAVANEAAFNVLAALEAGPTPPTAAEVTPYVNQLVSENEYTLAYLAWLHFLPKDQGPMVSFAYNGDFERPISGLPFDWMISSIAGAKTETVDSGDPERKRALRVTFANTRVAYRNLTKLMVLPPGEFALTGVVKADALANDRGMTWRIRCADGDKTQIAETNPIKGTIAWTTFATTFSVPTAGCDAQWLTLEVASNIGLEQEIGGEIWYDDIAVKRVDRLPAASG